MNQRSHHAKKLNKECFYSKIVRGGITPNWKTFTKSPIKHGGYKARANSSHLVSFHFLSMVENQGIYLKILVSVGLSQKSHENQLFQVKLPSLGFHVNQPGTMTCLWATNELSWTIRHSFASNMGLLSTIAPPKILIREPFIFEGNIFEGSIQKTNLR